MATLSILWHLHQPAYRTADGTAHAPWVALHAGGAYTTLVDAVLKTGAAGQILNVVPTLIEQLEAYAERRVDDPVLELFCRPVGELSDDERADLLTWAFLLTPRQLGRFPRLEALAAARDDVGGVRDVVRRFGRADLRDLQVLSLLAHAGSRAWTEPDLEPLFRQGRGFSSDQHERVVGWLRRQPEALLDRLRRADRLEGVEIATSPYAHPIVPLLIDTAVAEGSHRSTRFSRPDDARRQLADGLAFARERGLDVHGCWPPEGALSEAAVSMYGETGVAWLVTDEGLLEASLGRSVRSGGDLYRPWRLNGTGPAILFRDRELSDRIGFVYGRWSDETKAAADLVDRLAKLATSLPDDACVVLALDGENAWAHYPEGGGTFLETLFEAIRAGATGLRPARLADVARDTTAGTLTTLHAGTWIRAAFDTWIGHPEKCRGWDLLAGVRELLPNDASELSRSMVLAEGSDWFWWLGDDNPTRLAPLYDDLYRRHLADACRASGVDPPDALGVPLKPMVETVHVPISLRWREPVLDGRLTSYFEWNLAQRLGADDAAVALWSNGERLFLMVRRDEQIQAAPPVVELRPPRGQAVRVETRAGVGEVGAVQWCVDRVAEISAPWPAEAGWTLRIVIGDTTLPERGVLTLEPWSVDEEL